MFTNYLTGGFSDPYYTGGAVVSTVPGLHDVSIDGVGFLIDWKYAEANFKYQSIRLLRTQGDASNEPGEASVNPEGLWRRSKSVWHQGAGQAKLDRTDSQRAMFHDSKGIDCWTRGEISLLPATDQKATSANTNLKMVVAGSRLYYLDGTALKYTTDPTAGTWSATTVTSTGSNTKLDLASDGYRVWVTDGSDVYVTNTGTSAASSFDTEDIDVLGWAKGRLWGAENAEVFYESAGDFISLYTHGTSTFQWVAFTEGPNAVYAAGYAGDKSLIYRIGIRADATGPDQPIVAGELPDGEIVRSLGSYLGKVFIGTDKGWRFADPDPSGNLNISPNVATPAAVYCFEGQERFVWFGWTNFDGTDTGLGRFDISRWGDVEQRQPAYASDLMATAQGAVQSVVTFGDKRYFSVSGVGFYGEDTPLVSSGYLTSGDVNFGLADEKIALELDVNYGPGFAGSAAWSLATDGSSTFSTSVGTSSTADTASEVFPVTEVRASRYEIKVVLTRDGSDTATGPTVTGWTLQAQPAPKVKPQVILPLRIFQEMDNGGSTVTIEHPGQTVATLRALNESREVVVLQTGYDTESVILDDYEWLPDRLAKPPSKGWQGTFVAVCKVLT